MTNYNFIGIGINHYQYLQPLTYAQADIQTLDSFFRDEVRVSPQQTLTFTDNSPWIYERPTYPTKGNLMDWLRLGFHVPRKTQSCGSAVLWFAFSGYAVQHEGEDYLLPVDGKLADPVGTGISVRELFNALLQQGASKVIVLMDMNRSTAAMGNGKVGEQTLELASKLGIAVVLSCKPDEFSHETSALGHGMFTAALLEALRYYRSDLTLELLNNYLGDRLKELSDHHWRPVQTPIMVIPSLAAGRELILPTGEATKIHWQIAVPIGASLASMNGDRPEIGLIPSTNGHGKSSHITMGLDEGTMNLESEDDLPIAKDFGEDPFGEEPEIYHDFGAGIDEPLEHTFDDNEITDDAGIFDDMPEQENDPTQSVTVPESFTSPHRQKVWYLAGWQWLALLLYLLLGALGWRFFGGYAPQEPASVAPIPTDVKNKPETGENPAPVNGENGTESVTPQTEPLNPTQGTSVAPQNGQNPTNSGKPNSAKTPLPTTTKPTTATPTQNAAILTEANLVLRSSQASSFSQAIAAARLIKPGTPLYDEAQVQINRWSRVVLDIAAARAIKGDFSGAIAAARLVPNDIPPVNGLAQKSITKWQSQLTMASKNRQAIVNAQELIIPNQASSYSRAINVLKKIKPNEPSYAEARTLQNQWSRTIYLLANSRAAQDKFKIAIETAKLIPANSASYPAAQGAIARWQKQTP